jgi:hypothetical protein
MHDAVMFPILEAANLPTRTETNQEIIHGVNKIRDLYRDQILRLDQLHLKGLDNTAYWYARNCPSRIVMMDAEPRRLLIPCQRVDLCPWCWCRKRMANIWRRLKNVNEELVKTGKLQDTALRTISFGASGNNITGLYHIGRGTVSDWFRDSKRKEYPGSVSLTSVSPSGNSKGDPLLVRARILSIVSKSLLGESDECLIAEWDDPVAMRQVLSSFARYPVGMLLGEPALVKAILESKRKKSHLLRATGVLYSDNGREDDDAEEEAEVS